MSMNIHIVAERKITFKKKNGKRGSDVQRIVFAAVQTPTLVTYKIIESPDKKQAYIEYVKSCGRDEEILIYAEDDLFEENEPVGSCVYNWANEHIESFEEWLTQVDEDGYTVKFEVM